MNDYVCKLSQAEELKHFLGVNYNRVGDTLEMDQVEQIDKIYEDYKKYLPDSFRKPTSPMSPSRKCDPIVDVPQSKEEEILMKQLPFRSFLQRLCQVTTRHECKYALGAISRNQINPGLVCWYDLLRVMVWMYNNKKY